MIVWVIVILIVMVFDHEDDHDQDHENEDENVGLLRLLHRHSIDILVEEVAGGFLGLGL